MTVSRPIAPRPRPFTGGTFQDVLDWLRRNVEWANLSTNAINQLYDGRINSVGDFTFTENTTTTTLNDIRVAQQSLLLLTPITANAATAYAAGWHVSARTPGTSLVVTHANSANTDQDFKFALIG